MAKDVPETNATTRKTLKNFLRNTTIHSFNFLAMNISIYEKIFWTLLNVTTITLSAVWIYHLWLWYVGDSTFVTFEGYIPLQQIEYPGIAICNVNKISKRRVYEFAEQLSSRMKIGGVADITEDVKLIGNLYDFNMYRHERFQAVQEMLDTYDNESDPSRRIIALTTPCHDILHRCRWDNTDYPCSELFLTRLTFDGFCCVFNYVRPSKRPYLYTRRNFHDIPTEARHSHGAGITSGLEVVLKNDLEDYFYTTTETTGFKVHVFHNKEFPDLLSGSLKEILLGANQQVMIGVEVDVVKPTKRMKSVPIGFRKCMFKSESRTVFGAYRNSDCFAECKLKSMEALCGCTPFVMPVDPNSKYTMCTLTDVPCLHQHLHKWTKYHPHTNEGVDLELERQDSLHCDCLPMCNSVNYRIKINKFRMTNGTNDTSKLNIFFLTNYGNLYKLDMILTWFEMISTYGGLLGLVMGLSLVNVIEVLVLGCKILYYAARNLLKQN